MEMLLGGHTLIEARKKSNPAGEDEVQDRSR